MQISVNEIEQLLDEVRTFIIQDEDMSERYMLLVWVMRNWQSGMKFSFRRPKVRE